MAKEPVVPYMFPQEPKTIEELEESRKLYITIFNISKREKLEDYLHYFEDKVAETMEHLKLVETLREKEIKSKMLIFWKGLREEVKGRL